MVPGADRVHRHHVLPPAARATGRPRSCRRSSGPRSPTRRSERGDHLVVYSSGDEALIDGAAGRRRAVPRLRDARRARRGDVADGNLEFRPSLERGLRRGAAHRARRGRGRRLLAAQRSRLPRQAGPLGPPARPVRAADERALPGPPGYGLCAPRVDAQGARRVPRAPRRTSSARCGGYRAVGQLGRASQRSRSGRSRPRRSGPRERAPRAPRGAEAITREGRRARPRSGRRRLGGARASPTSTASTRPRSSTGGRSTATREAGRRIALTYDDGPNPRLHRGTDGRARRATEPAAPSSSSAAGPSASPSSSGRWPTRATRWATTPGLIPTLRASLLGPDPRGAAPLSRGRRGDRPALCEVDGAALMRPPWGRRRPATLRAVRRSGYAPVLWSITS